MISLTRRSTLFASGDMMMGARMSYVSGTLSIENLAFQPLRILDIDRTEA